MDLTMLFEMNWYDRSPLTAVLKRNRGRWIHFSRGAPNRDVFKVPMLPEPVKPDYYDRRKFKKYTHDLATVHRQNAIQRVPKLGVNPKSMWLDPKGIYFYPVDFLLAGYERMMSGNQYGLDAPFYFIVDLNLNDPNGINLGTMTWPDIEVIATRNGWINQMQEFRLTSTEEQKKRLFSYSRPDLPGSFFWHFIDRQVKDGKMSWAKAYKGVSYIRDPNLSIIHSNEPDQVLVLDPRVIKIVESGENKNPIKAGGGSDSIGQWMHGLLLLMKQVRGEYGGELTWMKKQPTLAFAKGMGTFILTIPQRSGGEMEPGLTLNAKFGRAEDSIHVSYADLLNKSTDELIQIISTKVEQIVAHKTDLLFKPLLPLAVAKLMMKQQMGNNLELPIKTVIHNSDTPRYNQLSMYGEVTREVDRVNIRTTCYVSQHSDSISGSVQVWAGQHFLISAQSNFNENFNAVGPMLASIADKVKENFDNMGQHFAPSEKSSYNYRMRRFGTIEEFTAFKGWVVLNCGLLLDGGLRQRFAADIAAFENYPHQRQLLSEIAYTMNIKW